VRPGQKGGKKGGSDSSNKEEKKKASAPKKPGLHSDEDAMSLGGEKKYDPAVAGENKGNFGIRSASEGGKKM